MGIFTDESHAERVQTDEQKMKRNTALHDEREMFGERQIRQDLTGRIGEHGIGLLIAGVVLMLTVLMMCMVKTVDGFVVFCFALVCGTLVAVIVWNGMYIRRYASFGRTIHVYKTTVEYIDRYPLCYVMDDWYPLRRRSFVTAGIRNYKTLRLPRKMYFSWSKDHACTWEELMSLLRRDAEVYVVSYDHVNAVAIYPCSLFRWEGDTQEPET